MDRLHFLRDTLVTEVGARQRAHRCKAWRRHARGLSTGEPLRNKGLDWTTEKSVIYSRVP